MLLKLTKNFSDRKTHQIRSLGAGYLRWRRRYSHYRPQFDCWRGIRVRTIFFQVFNVQFFRFRIIAVNKGGPSDPSDPSKSVVAKPRNLAPKIAPIQDLTIKAGQMIALEAVVEDRFHLRKIF